MHPQDCETMKTPPAGMGRKPRSLMTDKNEEPQVVHSAWPGSVKNLNHANTYSAPSDIHKREPVQRMTRPFAAASTKAPVERTSFLQDGSFKVRWGEVRAEPLSAARLALPSVSETSPTCEISSTREVSRQSRQPAKSQSTPMEEPFGKTVSFGDDKSIYVKTQGLYNTGSLLWRVKDRLSSAFWYDFRFARIDPVFVLGPTEI